MILAFCIFWTLLYVFIYNYELPFKPQNIKITYKDELDAKNRIISFIHGSVQLIFSSYTYYFKPGSCGESNSEYDKTLIYCAVGYFIYDITAMAAHGLLDITMTGHHLVAIVGMTLCLT